MTWTGDVKLVNESLDEWDLCEAKEFETRGMTDEYDVQSFLNVDLMSKESAAKYRRTAVKLKYLALDNPLIAFASEEASRSMSSPGQEEVKLKRILRFLRKRLTTISVRVAGSSPTLVGLVASSRGDPPVEELFYMDRTCCFTTHELKLVSLSLEC